MSLLRKLRLWLRESKRVHLREHRTRRMSDVVDLIDRFLDGSLEYDWEWDDFISWTQENSNVESTRRKITEIPDLYHPDLRIRRAAADKLIEERNHAAALAGMPMRVHGPRDFPSELQ